MRRVTLASLGVLFFASSCSDGRVHVRAPNVDSQKAAAEAIRAYDTNDDGVLDEQELASTALSLESWDGNGDQQLTATEIAEQLEKWNTARIAMVDASCSVTLDGANLAGAEVTYDPEEFLHGSTKESFGTTGSNGLARMSVGEEFRPAPSLFGVQPGLYRVRIVHPEIDVPAKYNVETKLFYELSPWSSDTAPSFALKSR